MLWAERLWNIPMMLEVVFFLPLWRDVLEYTCLLGYRGEEVNWFSVDKKSGLNAVRMTQFPWLPKTHWSPHSGCVLMNIKLSSPCSCFYVQFSLIWTIKTQMCETREPWQSWPTSRVLYVSNCTHTRTHTDTHTFAPCAMLLLHDKTWSVPGWWTIDPRGTGKNRETMATGFWGWVTQAVDKGGFRQREDQTSADRLSQVLIGEPGALARVCGSTEAVISLDISVRTRRAARSPHSCRQMFE